MCDVKTKLVAWLDRELTPDEASTVERHVAGCHECRRWVATYERVSRTFDAYCDAMTAARAPRRAPWVPVLAGALIAATTVCLAFLWTRVVPPTVIEPRAAIGSAAVPQSPPVTQPILHKPMIRRSHPAPHIRELARQEQPMGAAIQIAIPAEAMFPPGAVPNGINFIAELTIASDGSVKQVRLRQ
jgi:anti-sigma factor RsiW